MPTESREAPWSLARWLVGAAAMPIARALSLVLWLTLSAAVAGTPQSPNEPFTTHAFTTHEGTWISLDVAPDGRTIAFELLGDIYFLPSQGGEARPILTGRPFQSQPRFSPDGSQLVFVSDETGSDNVWIVGSDGSDPRALTALSGAKLLSPAWAADGSSVFVTVITSQGFSSFAEIWRYDASSAEGERLVENQNGPSARLVSAPAPGAYGPIPSPDGESVYFTSVTPRQHGQRNGASSSVMRLDLGSGAIDRVAVQGTNAMKPAISRDGGRLVYAAMKEGRTGLKLRELVSGSERWLVYPMQRNQLEARATRDVLPNFAIAPDGDSVLLEWNGRIHRIGLDEASDHVVPFEAEVNLAIEPRLNFPRRVDTGPVQVRRVQQLAVSSAGHSAISAAARIWVLAPGEDRPHRLTGTSRPREFMPAWSADSQWLAFVTWDEEGGHLWKARADGRGDPVRLSEEPAFWADPAWTPDGSAIVALRATLGSKRTTPASGQGAVPPDANLVVVSASDGQGRSLGPAEGSRRPHFGPDDGDVFVSATAGLVAVDLSNGARRIAARLPEGAGPTDLRLSPDGVSVLAVGRGPLRVFAVGEAGLDGEELEGAREIAGMAESAALVAWSGNRDGTETGTSLFWVSGMRLVGVDLSSGESTPSEVELLAELPRSTPTGSVILRGAKVITMVGDEVVEDADVVVEANRIAGVGPRGSVEAAADATIIDISGKVVVPGFIDVHAHFPVGSELIEPESTTSFANLAYGITTLRNPQTPPDVFALADVVEADAVPAPRIFSTGPGLFSLNLASLDAAREVVARYQGYGTHLLKWYMAGNRQQRQWLVEAAREAGMMPTTEGGADTKADLTYALDGFSGLEHAFPVAPIHDDLVQIIARTGITYTPTVVVAFGGALPIYRLLAEERPHENPKVNRWYPDGELFARTSTRLLWFPEEDYNDRDVARGANEILAAGGRVALGGHGEVQGLSNHWEMALLARGGMSRHDVLRVATIMGAEAIGLAQDLGSLEVGKLADLVVLDGDPLVSIADTQAIGYVMKNGVLYQGDTLDEVWPQPRKRTMPWSLERSAGPGEALVEIEGVIRETLASSRIPGAAVAVVRDGDVLLAKGFGIANLETGAPVTVDTMFQSGSLGKQWTAAGIMALVEDGAIELDASVRTYLEEAPTSWQPITVRHLLTHASGIPDYTSEDFDYETNYSEDDLVRMASTLELEFPAGARWNYSNTGYVMLGVIMSRVTGRPYWEFLRQRIFDPAGMRTIRVNTESVLVPHRARGYMPGEDGWTQPGYVAPMTNTTADGSMLLSLRDLLAWNEVVGRQLILSEESWEEMLRPMTLNSGRSYPYGFGWFIGQAGGGVVHQHGGSWQGFVTQYTRFEADDLQILILANARVAAVCGIPDVLGAGLNPALAPKPPPSSPIADADPEATRFVREMLTKVAHGELELSDFAFIRQTVFPRMKAALTNQLEGMGAPDRMELLSVEEVGDDRSLQYWAWYGERRLRVLVSLGPDGGLTALRVIPDLVQ